MTKRTFLKKLEDALQILNDEERKDILNEYKDHIKQKVKDGSTEAEAVKSFGDFDEIVNGILEAYKINTDPKPDDTVSNIIETIDHYVKTGVDAVSNAFSNINADNANSVIDIIVKIVFILFAIWLLRIPFFIIELIGRSFIQLFFPMLFTPINVVWIVLINLAYVAALILVIRSLVINFKLFKPESEVKTKAKTDDKKDNKPKIVKEPKTEPAKKANTANDVANMLFIIFKIWLIILVLPLFGVILACIIGLIVLIYLAISGVLLIGPILLLAGIWICSHVVIDFVFTLKLRGDVK